MTTYEPKPANSRKSFYGKTSVTIIGHTALVKSYNTDVCTIDTKTGKVSRHWSGYSNTTTCHINGALASLGFSPNMNAERWRSLPVKRFSWVDFYVGKRAQAPA